MLNALIELGKGLGVKLLALMPALLTALGEAVETVLVNAAIAALPKVAAMVVRGAKKNVKVKAVLDKHREELKASLEAAEGAAKGELDAPEKNG